MFFGSWRPHADHGLLMGCLSVPLLLLSKLLVSPELIHVYGSSNITNGKHIFKINSRKCISSFWPDCWRFYLRFALLFGISVTSTLSFQVRISNNIKLSLISLFSEYRIREWEDTSTLCLLPLRSTSLIQVERKEFKQETTEWNTFSSSSSPNKEIGFPLLWGLSLSTHAILYGSMQILPQSFTVGEAMVLSFATTATCFHVLLNSYSTV